jgi:hypothetical protein
MKARISSKILSTLVCGRVLSCIRRIGYMESEQNGGKSMRTEGRGNLSEEIMRE